MTLAVCGTASANTLVVSVGGQFLNSDIPGPLVTPGGSFNLQFDVVTNPTPLSGSVTSLGFDVPVLAFSYVLNSVPVNIMPGEIRFNTLANGGLFDITFGSGLKSSEFDFEGAQAFTGSTSAPVFSTGSFSVTSWTYSDHAGNFDSRSPASLSVSVVADAPEPVSVVLISGGLFALLATNLRRRRSLR
jgi:hypothetical protein